MKLAAFLLLPASRQSRLLRQLEEPSGHWQASMPTAPGWYAVADRQGAVRGFLQVVKRRVAGQDILVQAGNLIGSPGWAGLWWSEPAELPPGPEDFSV